MPYFRVDDGFYDHPKVKSLPRGNVRKGAIFLWNQAGSWSSRYLLDGLVAATQIEEFGASKRDADALVACRLWHAPGDECWSDEPCPDVPPGHFLYHQWPEHQDLKSVVEERRAKARVRMHRLRNGARTDDE